MWKKTKKDKVSGAVADACGWWHQWWLALVGVRGGGLVVLVGSDG